MQSDMRASASRHQRGRMGIAGIQWARKPDLSSLDVQAALQELALCFARAAVDAIVAELESRQLTALPAPSVTIAE